MNYEYLPRTNIACRVLLDKEYEGFKDKLDELGVAELEEPKHRGIRIFDRFIYGQANSSKL